MSLKTAYGQVYRDSACHRDKVSGNFEAVAIVFCSVAAPIISQLCSLR